MKPSEFDKQYNKNEKTFKDPRYGSKAGGSSASQRQKPSKKLIDDIPEDEKWRLIRETGVLDQFQEKMNKEKKEAEVEEQPEEPDYIFEAILYSIPFSTCYSVFEMLIFQQYGEPYNYKDAFWCFAKTFPILLGLIYYTNQYRTYRVAQALFMLAGSFAGCKTMGLVNDTVTFMEMQTCAGLATIYIYFIFQSDFVPCLIAVIIPALYYFYTKT